MREGIKGRSIDSSKLKMKATFLTSIISIYSTWASGISWGRGNSTKRQKRAAQEFNPSYQEFLKQAEKWLGANSIVTNEKRSRCRIQYQGIRTEDCTSIETEALKRDESSLIRQEKEIGKITREETDLYNLLVYSEPNHNKVLRYWKHGFDKISLHFPEPLKCEIVYFPVETIGMTITSDGSISNSQIESTSFGHGWKIGGKIKVETSKLSPVGSFSLSVSSNYIHAYKNVIRQVTKETFYNKYPSSCTPSLIYAGVMCHPTSALRILKKGGEVLFVDVLNIPASLVPNRDQDFFDVFVNCIDYLNDNKDFKF